MTIIGSNDHAINNHEKDFDHHIGVNPSILRQYKNRLAFASKKQAEKIKKGLHELGKELSSVQI